MCLDSIQFVDIVKCCPQDTNIACESYGGGCFAGIGEQNPGWIYTEAENCAHLFNGGAVEPRPQFCEDFEEGWVAIAFDRCGKMLLFYSKNRNGLEEGCCTVIRSDSGHVLGPTTMLSKYLAQIGDEE